MEDALANPVLNGPFEPPSRYFEIGSKGPTGIILTGRRPSESFIPVPQTKKHGMKSDADLQDALDFDLTHERVEKNTLINDLRNAVADWRTGGYEGTTPTTRKLLQHWSDPSRENRVLFCQREAAETAIYIAEIAGRQASAADWRIRVDDANAEHNDRLPRLALKMATGSGKTIVMAMLIAWNTLNKDLVPVQLQADFGPGADPCKRLKTALRAEIDEDAWASPNSTVSRPFPKPSEGRIAVKVINDYGDEVMKVFEVT